MGNDTERPMLGEHFAVEALAGAIQKKWSGGYEVSGFSVMITSMWVYQKGAILGRAKAENIDIFAKLIAVEGGEKNMREFFKNASERQLNVYGKEPSSFIDFLLKTMFPEIDMGNLEMLKALDKKKVRLGEILPRFQVDAATGIGFGAFHPEIVEKMWLESYEMEKDTDIWQEARQYGLDIPEKRSYIPIAEMEENVLKEVSEFVKEYHPSLITPLGLR